MISTFYMVEMDYPEREGPGRAAYEAFYERHVAMLLRIPGFLAAQRFECAHAAAAPFLAIYQLEGPEVMESEAYLSRGGRLSVPEAFRTRMANWDRNLVRGAVPHLEVPADGPESRLVLVDRVTADAPALPRGLAPLEVVGLDRAIAQRGVAAGAAPAPGPRDGWRVRTFRPIGAPRAR